MAQFFIDRPIFAWVIALFILVIGGVSIKQLPIAQYPTVAPPSIIVTAVYPGASAQTLEDSVISVIEQEMNGSPGLIYLESTSQANGVGTITLTLRVRHQRRPGPGRRAEPPLARRAAAARGGDAAGRPRRQGALELPAVHDPLVRQPGLRSDRPRRLRLAHRAARDPAPARRRPGAAVRHRAGDADLDRSGQAGRLQPLAQRRQQRDPGAERAGLVGHARRPADHRQPADQRDRRRRRPADDGRAVRRDRPARQHRRLDRQAARRRPDRARRPELRHLGAPERQALDRHRRAALADRQRARHRAADQEPDGRALALLPARREVRHPVRQLASSSASRSARWSRRWSRP